MSDNQHTSFTPIIVGSVIALLGILTGLYIADNAREQLALLTSVQEEETVEEGNTSVSQQPDTSRMPMETDIPDLPPVDPVAVPEMPETNSASVEEPVGEEAEGTVDDQEGEEVDDFIEVSPEELERVGIPSDSI